MSKPIKNEVSFQMYGDSKLQARILVAVANALDTEVHVTNEKPYETRAGKAGYYIAAKLKLSDS